MEATFDLMDKHVTAPTVLNRLPDIPLPLPRNFGEIKKAKIVPPSDLSNNLLDK
jgi:hypothetical protein